MKGNAVFNAFYCTKIILKVGSLGFAVRNDSRLSCNGITDLLCGVSVLTVLERIVIPPRLAAFDALNRFPS
jgi:hypothetical protein